LSPFRNGNTVTLSTGASRVRVTRIGSSETIYEVPGVGKDGGYIFSYANEIISVIRPNPFLKKSIPNCSQSLTFGFGISTEEAPQLRV
jgi:hypothetical protein